MVTSRSTDEAQVAEIPSMVLSGISKSYGGVDALTDVTLEVYPGEVHALLGENGAGKSTLMGIASGQIVPDAGTISLSFADFEAPSLTPALANELGIAIVHQHPALLPDMTIAENIRLGVPRDRLQSADGEEAAMRAILEEVGMDVHLNDRVDSLSVANKHLLEIGKALAVSPKLLILDEPTAPLGKESVDLLFEHVQSFVRRGTAIAYITHRLAEVHLIADRVTVLRDGKTSGTAMVEDVTDEQLLAWIVGRRLLGSTFPPKRVPNGRSNVFLEVSDLSGEGFSGIDISAIEGEIIGVAGVVGNGQSNLLAALAGLSPFEGTVNVNGTPYTSSLLQTKAAYIPSDRHREGLMMTLSARENASVSALTRFKQGPLLNRSEEVATIDGEFRSLDVRTASIDSNVASLSGGNQQKVVLARALLSEPAMVLADDPTQGVDVGARAEIYRILREVVDSGIPVIVASSDAHELEGLCDRVIVMSRGHNVAELEGDDVTEEKIVRAAVSATTHKDYAQGREATGGTRSLRRFLQGDYAPVLILALVILALGAYIYAGNDRYISAFNITSVLALVAALGFIAIGQTIVLMIGGIDLSVGPLAGFLVVVGSFFLVDEKTAGFMALGFVVMAAAAAAVGGINGALIRYGKFTAVAATLVTYIALGGLSFVLRDRPGGFISATITSAITTKVGPVPIAFILLVAIAVLMELALRKTEWGRRLRAVGSHEDSARRLGVRVNRTAVAAYVSASLFVLLGAVVLLAQLGIGDPAQGIGYTLSSITAVVLGGTSLLGGRGTFIGTLFGAFLIVQVQNATVFLGLSQTWQFFFQGALIMTAAIVYSQVRGFRRELKIAEETG